MKDKDAPKKSLGQHWLDDDASLDAMLAAAKVNSLDTVLEIGPGPGTLTRKLAAKARQVVAVEFDETLAQKLPERVSGNNVQVVRQDILRFDLNTLPAGYKVVANIPYYLTSKVLRMLCEHPNHLSRGALLVQKEVAERVCAPAGDMSLLSVSVQFYCEAHLGRLVPAVLFTPPPKVDSRILQLTFRDQPLFPGTDIQVFFRLVKAGFSQRRKTLLNSLSAGLHLERLQTTQLLEAAGISPTSRAQTLDLAAWHRLYALHTAGKT